MVIRPSSLSVPDIIISLRDNSQTDRVAHSFTATPRTPRTILLHCFFIVLVRFMVSILKSLNVPLVQSAIFSKLTQVRFLAILDVVLVFHDNLHHVNYAFPRIFHLPHSPNFQRIPPTPTPTRTRYTPTRIQINPHPTPIPLLLSLHPPPFRSHLYSL